MDRPTTRPFTILDGSILLGATVLGVAWIREFAVNALGPGPGWSGRELRDYLAALAFVSLPFVFLWTLALVVIRLRGPRPRLRRLARQPGMAACAAVTLGAALAALVLLPVPLAAGLLAQDAYAWSEPLAVSLAEDLALIAPLLGLGVAAAWTALTLGRRWSPDGGWIDRAGLVLGIVWLATIPVMGGYWLLALLG